MADEILNALLELSRKVLKFIKQNNIYGTAYREKLKRTYHPEANADYIRDLARCKERVEKTLAKKYVVDLLSDGSDELFDMLKTLWYAIEVIMYAPILVKKSVYTFEDGTTATNDTLKGIVLEKLSARYADVDSAILAFDFLSGKTEEELFDLYDKMIELDSFGMMGVNKQGLLKIGESEKQLNELIGLSGIKESIKKIKAYSLMNKDSDALNIHMCFLGNPGCGKTEVARLVAGILYENKILPTKKVIEVDRSGLVSEYFGATAEKTRSVIARAMGECCLSTKLMHWRIMPIPAALQTMAEKLSIRSLKPWKIIGENSVSSLPVTGTRCRRCSLSIPVLNPESSLPWTSPITRAKS